MGGNAIENTRRLQAEEYKALEKELVEKLGTIYPELYPLPYYRSKPDFGDMDIVVPKPKLERKDFEVFLNTLGSRQAVYNSDNISFEYKDFQIDLIFVEPEQVQSAIFYYAYNDLNNLVGRIAHKFGLKFGWDGLNYQIRTESGHRAETVLLSRDPAAIYTYLGYDYSRWQQGFDSLEEIFSFVVSSPYFSAEIYDDENLNHINRTRNRKRKTYSAFLEWLTTHDKLPAYAFEKDKSIYLIRTHNAFESADFLGQLRDYARRVREYEQRYAKFNGKLVQAWTGLEGKALGQIMQSFKTSQTDFDIWLDKHDKEQVESNFRAFLASLPE